MAQKKIAQYKQIEYDLLEKINLGYYKKGDLIPTELELASTYHVSRVTVRKATDNLVARGLLSRMAGVGTSVCQPSVTSNPSQIQGFTDVMTALGIIPSTKVTVFSLQEASSNIASILNIEKNESIYLIQRQRFGDEQLLQLETSYMSARLYPDLSVQLLQQSKYRYFEEVKHMTIAYSHHTVTPIHPSRDIAELFDISVDTPIIKVANITYLENGQVMDYTELILNSPKYQLTYVKR